MVKSRSVISNTNEQTTSRLRRCVYRYYRSSILYLTDPLSAAISTKHYPPTKLISAKSNFQHIHVLFVCKIERTLGPFIVDLIVKLSYSSSRTHKPLLCVGIKVHFCCETPGSLGQAGSGR